MKRQPTAPTRPAARPARRGCVATALLLGCAGAALAQSSPYYIALAQSLGRDSNLLRLSTDQAVPAGFEKADTVSTTSLLAGFDQPIGRQRVQASVALRDFRYGHNSVFDNRGYSARAGLDWSTVERLSGSLTASASRSLQRFNSEEVGFLNEKNLETVKALNARVSLGLVSQFSLELAGGRSEVRNSLAREAVQAREFNQGNASLGLQWRPGSATTLGLALGSTRGRYPKFRSTPAGFDADRFQRSDLQLTAAHQPTGASRLEARLSSGRTRFDLNEQRDFSGLTGSLAWTWQASGKLVLVSSFTRDTGQDSYATSVATLPATADYSRSNQTLRVQADYAASAKLGFSASVMRYARVVVRTVDNPLLPINASGRDATVYLALGARWTPRRWLQAGCDLGSERRRASGQLVSNLDGGTFSCFGQITLQ